MKILKQNQLDDAVDALREGKIVVFPTDLLWHGMRRDNQKR